MNVDKDAFSHSQIESKLWLCNELEQINFFKSPTVWVLGGWQGVLSFLLLTRNNIDIKKIRSFDEDPLCEPVADLINNTWLVDNWKFKAETTDANRLSFSEPDIIINTSTEHFVTQEWFNKLPSGKLVCVQGNNLNHEDHFSKFENFDDFSKEFKFGTALYQGERKFTYPSFSFTRYMIIGIK